MKKIAFILLFIVSTTAFSKEDPLCEIYLNNQKKISYKIEWAKTPKQKEMGLMYRTYLKEDQGMLFSFDPEQVIHMWMKNTFIPLDMLFINKQHEIVHFYEKAKPMDTTIISSLYPVVQVLEIKGGEIQKHHLQKGMKISCH